MKRTTRYIALLFALIAVLTAGGALIVQARGRDAQTVDVELEGTSWTLVQLGDTVILPEGAPTLRFVDGQVQGNATCNGFFGSFEREGGSLTFGPLGSTMMACPGLDQEIAYLDALAAVTAYRLEGERLVLSDGVADLLVFAAA